MTLISYFEKSRNSCETLLSEIKVPIEVTHFGEAKHKHVIQNLSEFIKVLVVDCQEYIINNMTLYGTLGLSHNDLVDMFSRDKSVYSVHDDVTFHFFEVAFSSCIVSYFSEGKIDEMKNPDAALNNISFS